MLHLNIEPNLKVRRSEQSLSEPEGARGSAVTAWPSSHFQDKPLALDANAGGQHPPSPDTLKPITPRDTMEKTTGSTLLAGVLQKANEQKIVILRLREFMRRTGLSRSATYYKMDPDHPLHDPLFPRSIRLGLHGRAVGWVESECNAYLESLISASRKHNSLGESE